MGGKSKSSSSSNTTYTTTNLNMQGVDGPAVVGDGNSVADYDILTDSRSFTDSRSTVNNVFDGGTARAALDTAEHVTIQAMRSNAAAAGKTVAAISGANDRFMDGAEMLVSDVLDSSDRASQAVVSVVDKVLIGANDLVGRSMDASRDAIRQAGATINSVARGDAGEQNDLIKTGLYVAGGVLAVMVVARFLK